MTDTPASLPPDRGHLLTEQADASLHDLDTLDTGSLLRVINERDATVPAIVARAIGAMTPLVDAVAAALAADGRLIYLGAGTSGRLGVLDASECPPTYSTRPEQVVGLIAGGDGALRQSSESREDDPHGATADLDRLAITPRDVVVGIAAGGTTPYVLGGLAHVRAIGCVTGLICCIEPGPAGVADHLIELPVGPEVITGSSRLKAGTATKLALNMITTAAMVRLGKTWGNLMVDVRVTNSKLRDRAARILTQQTGLDRTAALDALAAGEGSVKCALVMVLRQVDIDTARQLLATHQSRLAPILGRPR